MSEPYRILKAGEIILDGDLVDVSPGWNDEPEWRPTRCVGEKAPEPKFPGHRIYRRPIPMTDELNEGELMTHTAEKLRRESRGVTFTDEQQRMFSNALTALEAAEAGWSTERDRRMSAERRLEAAERTPRAAGGGAACRNRRD